MIKEEAHIHREKEVESHCVLTVYAQTDVCQAYVGS